MEKNYGAKPDPMTHDLSVEELFTVFYKKEEGKHILGDRRDFSKNKFTFNDEIYYKHQAVEEYLRRMIRDELYEQQNK